MILLMSGCEDETDQRLMEMAQRHSARQAEQSQQMLELQQEVAIGSRELVEADARARAELVAQQSGVNQQRDQLEQDRKAIAAQRYRDPLIAAVITHLGLIAICLLPLVLCWQLLRQPNEPATNQELTEILLNDLVSAEPLLLLPEDQLQRLASGQSQPPELLSHSEDQPSV
jgi:hypothetical protein